MQEIYTILFNGAQNIQLIILVKYRRLYYTQLYGDYYKPLKGSPVSCQNEAFTQALNH